MNEQYVYSIWIIENDLPVAERATKYFYFIFPKRIITNGNPFAIVKDFYCSLVYTWSIRQSIHQSSCNKIYI